MPSVKEMVECAQTFLLDIMPQASVSVPWTVDKAQKAFTWAKYCEDMHQSLDQSGHLKELEEALLAAGSQSGRPSVFQRDHLIRAPLLLLEEFLRNPNLSEDSMVPVMQGMSKVFSPDKFQSLCREAVDRKALHQKAINLIQSVGDAETISSVKAMILKEDLLQDLEPGKFQSKLDPLLKSVSTTELILTVLNLSCQCEALPEVKLTQLITRGMEQSVKNWLDGRGQTQTISALLAVPVMLSRKLCEISPNFLQSWLDVLALLAGHLTPLYYAKEHVWSWPDDDESAVPTSCASVPTDSRFRALWFSFDQLVRHMQSLYSSGGRNCSSHILPSLNEDHVTSAARQFLDRQKQLPGLCSIWLEVEQRLSITASN